MCVEFYDKNHMSSIGIHYSEVLLDLSCYIDALPILQNLYVSRKCCDENNVVNKSIFDYTTNDIAYLYLKT